MLLSTALVYGARTSNPLPLSEDAPLLPNPDFSWAVVRADIEKLATEWRKANRDATVAVLRPTAVVTEDDLGQLARVLHTARVGVAADGDPPVQYLHIDDLAGAVVTATLSRADGPLNVAPDGWIPPDALRELEGPKPRLRVPLWLARALAAARLQAGVAPIPPGVVPYTSHSWVIASDRLRALGWEPGYSNEEAWVVSHNPSRLTGSRASSSGVGLDDRGSGGGVRCRDTRVVVASASQGPASVKGALAGQGPAPARAAPAAPGTSKSGSGCARRRQSGSGYARRDDASRCVTD